MLPASRRVVVLALAGVFLASCRRREEGVFITAPFNDETRIAKVEAQWEPSATGLRFEVRVENRLADNLFVRVKDFALLGSGGQSLASGATEKACVLPAHATRTVLSGDLDLGGKPVASIAAFEIDRFGVPLSERGRNIYREFLLQQQVRSAADIDAELAAYASAPLCD